MAGRIAGITIEIGGDTTKLQKALKGVDSQLKTTQSNLKDINKLLKMDPSNVELLTQKQRNLENAIKGTKDRLTQLKDAQAGVKEGSAEWDALQREIIATEQSLKGLEGEYRNFGSVTSQLIKATGQKMQELGGKIENVGKKLQPLSTAATGALAALGGLAYKSITAADDLNTMAKQTGLSTDELQRMQYASDLVDVSMSDMTGAVTKVKKAMTGNDEMWAEFGIEVRNADGSMRDATDVFYESLQALSQIENETERDQAAMKLFGKSADSLAGIIDDGGQALREYGDEAENLGLIMSGDTLNALNETNDTLDRMKANVGASLAKLGATLATTFAPAIEKLAGLIGQLTEKLRNMKPETAETIVKILAVVAALGPVLTIGGKLISGLGTMISVIGTVVGVLGGPLTIAIAAVVAAGVLLYKNWDKVKATAIAVKDGVVNAFNTLKAGINNAIDAVKSKIDTLKQKFEDLKTKVTGIWETIKGILTGQISLPKIPLPHFSVIPEGWKLKDLLNGVIPRLGINWYKRAYTDPVMFSSPTVLATPNGYKGFGDGNGAEIVLGLNKLRELVGAQAGNVTINVYPSAGMDETKLAQKIQQVYVNAARNRGLVNG